MINDPGYFVRGGGDGFRSPEFCAHPAKVMSQVALASIEPSGTDARAVADRFLTLRVLTESIFPPLTRLPGQSPSQEVNVGALANRERSGPISAKRVWAVRTLTPGICVRSTPKTL